MTSWRISRRSRTMTARRQHIVGDRRAPRPDGPRGLWPRPAPRDVRTSGELALSRSSARLEEPADGATVASGSSIVAGGRASFPHPGCRPTGGGAHPPRPPPRRLRHAHRTLPRYSRLVLGEHHRPANHSHVDVGGLLQPVARISQRSTDQEQDVLRRRARCADVPCGCSWERSF